LSSSVSHTLLISERWPVVPRAGRAQDGPPNSTTRFGNNLQETVPPTLVDVKKNTIAGTGALQVAG